MRDMFPSACQRCYKETPLTIMSKFNTDILCIDCSKAEREHPDYEKAVAADDAQIRQGNYNFGGIGRPRDL